MTKISLNCLTNKTNYKGTKNNQKKIYDANKSNNFL